MKALLILIGCAVLNGIGITYAHDATFDQAQFDARIEQTLLKCGDYTVEKEGNVITMTLPDIQYANPLRHSAELEIRPLEAKDFALLVLEMDALQPPHEAAAFIKVLICESDGEIVGEAVVFRSDYANLSALHTAQNDAFEKAQTTKKKWIKKMEQYR